MGRMVYAPSRDYCRRTGEVRLPAHTPGDRTEDARTGRHDGIGYDSVPARADPAVTRGYPSRTHRTEWRAEKHDLATVHLLGRAARTLCRESVCRFTLRPIGHDDRLLDAFFTPAT